MQTLESFSKYLEAATAKESEVFDLHFEEIVSLVEQEEYARAASKIAPILEEGCLDVRLVMYLFYSHLMEEGVSTLTPIFQNIVSLIDDYSDKITPIQNRDKHIQTSLIWFFSTLSKKLRLIEKLLKDGRSDPFWEKSITNLSIEPVEKLQAITTRLIEFFTHKWENPTINQHVMFLLKWLKELDHLPSEEQPQEVSEEKPLPPEEKTEKVIEKPVSTNAPKGKGSLEETLCSSEEMQKLHQKLQTFDALIKKEDFPKAALIADDITQVIENFDPATFFPKLFSHYFSLHAKHIQELARHWEKKSSLEWSALKRLYDTDLEEFIKW